MRALSGERPACSSRSDLALGCRLQARCRRKTRSSRLQNPSLAGEKAGEGKGVAEGCGNVGNPPFGFSSISMPRSRGEGGGGFLREAAPAGGRSLGSPFPPFSGHRQTAHRRCQGAAAGAGVGAAQGAALERGCPYHARRTAKPRKGVRNAAGEARRGKRNVTPPGRQNALSEQAAGIWAGSRSGLPP